MRPAPRSRGLSAGKNPLPSAPPGSITPCRVSWLEWPLLALSHRLQGWGGWFRAGRNSPPPKRSCRGGGGSSPTAGERFDHLQTASSGGVDVVRWYPRRQWRVVGDQHADERSGASDRDLTDRPGVVDGVGHQLVNDQDEPIRAVFWQRPEAREVAQLRAQAAELGWGDDRPPPIRSGGCRGSSRLTLDWPHTHFPLEQRVLRWFPVEVPATLVRNGSLLLPRSDVSVGGAERWSAWIVDTAREIGRRGVWRWFPGSWRSRSGQAARDGEQRSRTQRRTGTSAPPIASAASSASGRLS